MRAPPDVRIPRQLWELTWEGLRARSGDDRESACVWAGDRLEHEWLVRSVLFLDDFGPVSAGPLHHRASRVCVARLFSTLRERGGSIVVDVHCHPEAWVDLSPTDEDHPIEFRIGLLAMVLPNCASTTPDLRAVGVHEYIGTSKWRRLSVAQVSTRFRIE